MNDLQVEESSELRDWPSSKDSNRKYVPVSHLVSREKFAESLSLWGFKRNVSAKRLECVDA